jgi:beta-lactamase class A
MSRSVRLTALLLSVLPVLGARAQSRALATSRLVASTRAGATPRVDTVSLHRTLDSLARHFHGVLGYSINNLDTGERMTLRGDETFPTASLIKVAVLVTLFDLADKGLISLDDQLTLLKIDQVPGSGVLQFMHPGMTLSVRDAAVLMSILSDNTATNLLLDKIVIRRVWQKMEALGLPHTKVHSKVFLRIASVAVDSSAKYGLGVTTPNEMARLFELMVNGRAVSPKADSAMIEILGNNQDMELMQRTVSGIAVPHKTGATDSVRTECAFFRLQSRIVACALTKQNVDTRWIVDNEPQLALGKIGEAILRTWPRKQERADDSR